MKQENTFKKLIPVILFCALGLFISSLVMRFIPGDKTLLIPFAIFGIALLVLIIYEIVLFFKIIKIKNEMKIEEINKKQGR